MFNIPTEKGKYKDSKSAATIEEKEMSKQWEGKQDPWTEAKTMVRVEEEKSLW